jgi:UDP-2,3-diacylglucosamine pyrophosphatase LpxH
MRKLIQKILWKPVMWIANRFSSRPQPVKIYKALSALKEQIQKQPGKKGLLIPFDIDHDRIIVFSDQHKGAKDGADDFMLCEPAYLAAMDYYEKNNFHFISLGDNEELWENRWPKVKDANKASFDKEKNFIRRNAFVKIFGNHDLAWNTDLFTELEMQKVYDEKIKVHEGVVLQARAGDKNFCVLLTHGHQGDAQSDGNWFSKFFIAHIWAPLQAYVRINPNTPAYDNVRKTLHNRIMYEWSASQKDTLLISGHTHQPVFGSLTHLERLYRKLLQAEQEKNNALIESISKEIRLAEPDFKSVSPDYNEMKPSYFNSGCCCFSDGDITGIEMESGCIRLIKWESKSGSPVRLVLEESPIREILDQL